MLPWQSKRVVVMDLRNDYEWDAGEHREDEGGKA